MIPMDRISLLQMVSNYVRRGWSPIPVARGKKSPSQKNWPSLRLTERDLAEHFSHCGNVGVILGKSSAWLVDVDLDSIESIKLADRFLPPTGSIFGRPTKPKSHRLYVCEGASTVQFRDPTNNTSVAELRSGPSPLQTIFPPSFHPSGEQIAWECFDEPALVEATDLRRCVARLASASLVTRYGSSQDRLMSTEPSTWPFHELPPSIRAVAMEWSEITDTEQLYVIVEQEPAPSETHKWNEPASAGEELDKVAQVYAVRKFVEQCGFKLICPTPYQLKHKTVNFFPTKKKITIDNDPKVRLNQSPEDFLSLLRKLHFKE